MQYKTSIALEVKECISYKDKAKRKNYERERVEATCILVLILIEQLTTCYILVDSLCERRDYKQCTM